MGDHPWFCGPNISFVDFHMYELLWEHNKFVPEMMAKHSKLTTFMKRFEALPKIKAYLESSRYHSTIIKP